MNSTTHLVAPVLNSLIETCKDGQYGFQCAAEAVQNADFKRLFAELSSQRGQFISELQTAVSEFGDETEKSGCLAGTLHRGWIDIKAALSSGDEHTILAECERGEDSAVAEYRDALAHEELPTPIRDMIQEQYMAVQAAHNRVRELRDRFQK